MDMNAREIIEWVETQIVDVSNEQSVKSFVVELQNKINELDFSLKDGTIPIGYAGSIESTGIYKTIELFTQNSGGKYLSRIHLSENRSKRRSSYSYL